MRYNLKKELKSAFDAPPPSGKEEFFSRMGYPKASRADFIIAQLGYIRKRVWVLSLLLFAGTLLCLYILNIPASLVWFISSVLPFISLVSISEMAKSYTYGMEELEMSCKYNLLEVSLIRLGILGITNLAVLTGILVLFACKTDFGLIRLGLYLITPYLLSCYGTLFVANRLKSRETMYVCGGVTAFVSIINTMVTQQVNEIYSEKYWMFWSLTFVILIVLCVKEIVKLIRKMEDLQWNSSLTA